MVGSSLLMSGTSRRVVGDSLPPVLRKPPPMPPVKPAAPPNPVKSGK